MLSEGYINNTLHLAQKYARIFVCGHYLFREVNSFLRVELEENVGYKEQIMSKDKYPSIFFPPEGGYCVYYPSNLFRNAHSSENWGILNNYSPKWR